MQLHGTSKINAKGHLEIGGVDTVQLAAQYGTPLYIYDLKLIREKAEAFREAFRQNHIRGEIAYASKAFSCIAMLQLVHDLNLSLDVVSGGELYTALKAGFPPEKIHFHGNNKSVSEVKMALEAGVGTFVVDNFYELEMLQKLTSAANQTKILLRITPGVEAYTHRYIATGGEDSKFGFDLENGSARQALKTALAAEGLELVGVHCHIGSQIFDVEAFRVAIEKIFGHIQKWKEDFRFVPRVFNAGGGFGIRYVEDDQPRAIQEYVQAIAETVKKEAQNIEIAEPEIWIEPGRALIGNAGTTLYTIGSTKNIPGVREYIAVDGGMSDNLRPALYDARYEAFVANRAHDQKNKRYAVAGKCCESGDLLIQDVPLPSVQTGDLLAVFSTGAYGYSMANNYNKIPRPAVVFVEDGEASLVIERETYEDLIRHELPLKKRIFA